MTNVGGNRAYLGVGIAFIGVAVAMFVTMDNWAVALPFGVLAVVFISMGARSSDGAEPRDEDPGTL